MKNATHIQFIIDRSGSMHAREHDVIGGFNRFIADQKKDRSECHVSMTQFSTDYVESFRDVPLQFVAPLTHDSYVTGGGTALLDAMGRTIVGLGARLAALPENERPRNIVVVTMTDGEENASHEYHVSRIREMVEHQQSKYKWTFVFIGADIDAFAIGQQLGIVGSNIARGRGTAKGYGAMYAMTSNAVLRSRDAASSGKDLQPQAFYSVVEQDKIANADDSSDQK